MKKKIFTVLCVAVMGLSACSAPTVTPSLEDFKIMQREAVKKADNVDSQAVEKINDIIVTPELINNALQKAATQCMTSRGFQAQAQYYMPPSETVRDFVVPTQLSIQEARDNGYNTARSRVARERENTNFMSPEEVQAYQNPSSGDSCQKTAQVNVFGDADLTKLYFDVGKYILPYVNAAITSEDAQNLDKEWSECMASKGHNYPSPSAAIVDVVGKSEAHEVAVADATCREQVRFEERTEEILDAYMTTFLNDNQALLERVAQAKKNAEANAPKLLDGSAS